MTNSEGRKYGIVGRGDRLHVRPEPRRMSTAHSDLPLTFLAGLLPAPVKLRGATAGRRDVAAVVAVALAAAALALAAVAAAIALAVRDGCYRAERPAAAVVAARAWAVAACACARGCRTCGRPRLCVGTPQVVSPL